MTVPLDIIQQGCALAGVKALTSLEGDSAVHRVAVPVIDVTIKALLESGKWSFSTHDRDLIYKAQLGGEDYPAAFAEPLNTLIVQCVFPKADGPEYRLVFRRDADHIYLPLTGDDLTKTYTARITALGESGPHDFAVPDSQFMLAASLRIAAYIARGVRKDINLYDSLFEEHKAMLADASFTDAAFNRPTEQLSRTRGRGLR